MGKIKVNPSTGKVLVFRDSSGSRLCNTCCFICEFCPTGAPRNVSLTFSDSADADPSDCLLVPLLVPDRYGKFGTGGGDSLADIINGEHELELRAGFSCQYIKEIEDVNFEWELYQTFGTCASLQDTFNPDKIRIIARQATSSGVIVTVSILNPPSYVSGLTFFQGAIIFTGDDSCFNTDNSANNALVGGAFDGTGIVGIIP